MDFLGGKFDTFPFYSTERNLSHVECLIYVLRSAVHPSPSFVYLNIFLSLHIVPGSLDSQFFLAASLIRMPAFVLICRIVHVRATFTFSPDEIREGGYMAGVHR